MQINKYYYRLAPGVNYTQVGFGVVSANSRSGVILIYLPREMRTNPIVTHSSAWRIQAIVNTTDVQISAIGSHNIARNIIRLSIEIPSSAPTINARDMWNLYNGGATQWIAFDSRL